MHTSRKLSAAVLIAASSLGVAEAAGSADATLATPSQIERIEPAFWWVGMKSDKLQLMVHGPRIAEAAPQIANAAGLFMLPARSAVVFVAPLVRLSNLKEP